MSTTKPEALHIADLESQLAAIGAGFTAADMATAAAQGFRDGVASLSLPAAGQEPVAWLSVDCIGERYLCFTRPDDDDPVRPLVFGDTAPSVLEDAARYRWLREQPFDTWKLIAWNTWNNDPAVWPDRDAAIDAAIDATRKQEGA